MSPLKIILGFESSCDETACALVTREGRVIASEVASQVDIHARFGGVVPEVASRHHLEVCLPLAEGTLRRAGVGWDDIEAVAVTRGPGLIGCLLIGVETAKALAWRHDKPLIPVHHLHAHLHAPLLEPDAPGATHLMLLDGTEHRVRCGARDPEGGGEDGGANAGGIGFPHVGLIVSGGHTSLALVEAPGRCRTLSTTRDDAVGEAYDKIARVLGIGFPGGPVMDRRAAEGDPARCAFTVPLARRDVDDFSFSGLKTAAARRGAELGLTEGASPNAPPDAPAEEAERERRLNDLCAGFQHAVIESLLSKSLRAAAEAGVRDLLIVGGVACNRGLRRAAAERAPRGLRVWFPHPSLCTDNAAMIAGLAWHLPALSREAMLSLNPESNMPLERAADEEPAARF